jgi:hypothetical protein
MPPEVVMLGVDDDIPLRGNWNADADDTPLSTAAPTSSNLPSIDIGSPDIDVIIEIPANGP